MCEILHNIVSENSFCTGAIVVILSFLTVTVMALFVMSLD